MFTIFLIAFSAAVTTALLVVLNRHRLHKPSKVAGSDILSAADVSYTQRCEKLLRAAHSAGSIDTYEGQAAIISNLLRNRLVEDVSGLLRANAHDLFVLHREAGPFVEGGLGVRITVQVGCWARGKQTRRRERARARERETERQRDRERDSR